MSSDSSHFFRKFSESIVRHTKLQRYRTFQRSKFNFKTWKNLLRHYAPSFSNVRFRCELYGPCYNHTYHAKTCELQRSTITTLPRLRCAPEIVLIGRKVPLIRPLRARHFMSARSAFKFVSDQTQVRSNVYVLVFRNWFWLDSVALEIISNRKASSAGLSTILRPNRLSYREPFVLKHSCTRTV